MKYNEELQQISEGFDDNFNIIEVPNGDHVGKYDGEAPVYFNTLQMPSLRMTIEANRIFKTKAHMLAYINDQLLSDGSINRDENGKPTSVGDTVKSALPGLILTVINDDDPDNNGMYYIENADPNTTPGLSAAKINITGPIPNSEIDKLFPTEEQGQTGSTEGGTTEGTEGDDSGFTPLPPDPGMDS